MICYSFAKRKCITHILHNHRETFFFFEPLLLSDRIIPTNHDQYTHSLPEGRRLTRLTRFQLPACLSERYKLAHNKQISRGSSHLHSPGTLWGTPTQWDAAEYGSSDRCFAKRGRFLLEHADTCEFSYMCIIEVMVFSGARLNCAVLKCVSNIVPLILLQIHFSWTTGFSAFQSLLLKESHA